MSRVRTLWGAMFALLMVIGLVAPAFAQDTAADTATAGEDQLLAPTFAAPSPAMALDDEAPKSWWEKIKMDFYFRFRQMYNYSDGRPGTHPITDAKDFRMRYKLAIGISGAFDEFAFGIQLASSGTNTSANETYGSGSAFGNGGLFIRQAWAKVGVGDGKIGDKMLEITLGRMPWPKEMYRSILTWDSDIAPTGVHVALHALNDKESKTKLTVNAMTLLVIDDSSTLAADNVLFAGSVDFQTGLGEGNSLRVGGGLWTVTHVQSVTSWQFDGGTFGGFAFKKSNWAAMEGYVHVNFGGIQIYYHGVYNFESGSRGYGAIFGVTFWTAKSGTEGAFGVDVIAYYSEIGAWPTGFSDADAGLNGTMSGWMGIEVNPTFYITKNVAFGMEMDFFLFNEDVNPGSAADNDGGFIITFDAIFKW